MNSMSKRCYDDCQRDRKTEEETCPTIIKCGCPRSTQLPVLTAITTTNLTLASLTVDTSCICDPVIKLDFSSVFTTIAAIVIGGVSIQVFRQCGNQLTPVAVGPSYTVLPQITTAAVIPSVFTSFSICDEDSCFNNDCCTYTVVATVTGPLAATVGAAFNNSTLTATVTCKNSCHKCRREQY